MRVPALRSGFTRIDLLLVVATLAILTELFLPALGKTGAGNQAMSAGCMNNMRQLITAWHLYAFDFNERVVNNYGLDMILDEIASKRFENWANNVMTWKVADVAGISVTNEAWAKSSVLSPYTGHSIRIFKCPADTYLSAAQLAQGFKTRLRSVSMNSFFGRFSRNHDITEQGKNWGQPEYRQYLKTMQVRAPSKTWVLVDEQADSINDGYFVNADAPVQWGDAPGPYHSGGSSFVFADGHTEIHKWKSPTSIASVTTFGFRVYQFDAIGRKTDWKWYFENTGYTKF